MQSFYGSCEKQGFVQVAVRRAVRLRECPMGEVSMSCSHAVNILSLFCLRGDLQFLYYSPGLPSRDTTFCLPYDTGASANSS